MSEPYWEERALDQLAAIYVAAEVHDRVRISSAVEIINRRLSDDPANAGESRGAHRRLLIFDCVQVLYTVHSLRGTIVLEAKWNGRKRSR